MIKKRIELNCNNNLVFNYLCDLKKKEIDKFERAKIIRDYMQINKLSGRGLAQLIDVPKSTVEDWLLFDKLPEEMYQEMKKNGLTDTDIYRELREKKVKPLSELNLSKFDREIEQFHKRIKGFINKVQPTTMSHNNVKELINTLNRILIRIEKYDKER